VRPPRHRTAACTLRRRAVGLRPRRRAVAPAAAGFTLSELLVSLAIVAVVAAGVFALQRQGQSAYLMGASRVEAQQNARVALERFARELRLARGVAAAPGCNNAATGGTDITFTFVDDTGTDVTVRYYLSGASLLRHQTAPAPIAPQPETMVAGVEALGIWCYRADGTLAPAPADTRSVRVSLRTRQEDPVATGQPGRQQAIVESRVRMRNLL